VRRRKSATPLTDNIGSKFAGKKFVRKRAFVGAAMLLIIPYIGSSLAATVTINGTSGSGGIEFGQGSQVTVVCDSTIKTSIDEDWYASGSPSPYFRVKTISLTGINNASALNATTDNQGCGGKALTLKLYATDTIVDVGTTAGENSATFTIPVANAGAGTPSITGATGLTATSNGGASESSIVLTISNSLNINAADITRVVLESSN
jgi:hypothetical protein